MQKQFRGKSLNAILIKELQTYYCENPLILAYLLRVVDHAIEQVVDVVLDGVVFAVRRGAVKCDVINGLAQLRDGKALVTLESSACFKEITLKQY